MENNKGKFEEDIMSKIRSGKVKLRSKYIFIAEKLGLESAFALSAILSVLFANLFFFYLKTTDSLEYLSFGSEGIYAFLESFPHLLVAVFIIFIMAAGYLLKKADFFYKRSFKYFSVSLTAFTFVSSGVIAYAGIPEKIEEEAFNEGSTSFIVRPFLGQAIELRNTGLSGRVFETGDDYLVIETPNGLQKVDLVNLQPDKNRFANEQIVIAIGERGEDVFMAHRIRVVGESGMQMIRRGIRRNSDQNSADNNAVRSGFIMKAAELKNCMDNCLMLAEFRRRCFDDCSN